MPKNTFFHKIFFPIKTYLPAWLSRPIRNLFTAVLTPYWFSIQSGHFRNSFKALAVSKEGKPLPWYTYPCIDFLSTCSFQGKIILEFGGGQSTYWWALRARQVVTIESDRVWYSEIKSKAFENVSVFLVNETPASQYLKKISELLNEAGFLKFDIIIIDSMFYREELAYLAAELVSEKGVIICDNSGHFDFKRGLKNKDLKRVDFFGHVPGVMLPNCTSIFFYDASSLFEF